MVRGVRSFLVVVCLVMLPLTACFEDNDARRAPSNPPAKTRLSNDRLRLVFVAGTKVAGVSVKGQDGFVRIKPQSQSVCFRFPVRGANAAHLHDSARPENPVVGVLFEPPSPRTSGCSEEVDRELLRAVIRDPERFYVDFHHRAAGPSFRVPLESPGTE